MIKPLAIIIVGPTAVGKTEFAIEIAEAMNGEIVSADSMQIYKFMDIGSAKPNGEQLSRVRHHLIDEIDPREAFSAAEYQKMTKVCISDIVKRGKTPIISGGTGLYVNSLIYNMDFSVMPNQSDFRLKLEEEAAEFGFEFVHDKLKSIDEATAKRIHPHNLRKVIRALEVYATTGISIREFEDSFVKTEDYDFILIGLTRARDELYNRINDRVDLLLENGLIVELENLLKLGLTEDSVSMKGIGYKEIIGYLKGRYDYEEARRLVKQNSRRYAKRQLTWFKRYTDIRWFNLTEYKSNAEALDEVLLWIKLKRDIIINRTSQIT
jgi:tRNA dimethylallyltransferase